MVSVHTSDSPMVELRRLHRFFGLTKAVNDISFEVRKGQVFGYIGPMVPARRRVCGSLRLSNCQHMEMRSSMVSLLSMIPI